MRCDNIYIYIYFANTNLTTLLNINYRRKHQTINPATTSQTEAITKDRQ